MTSPSPTHPPSHAPGSASSHRRRRFRLHRVILGLAVLVITALGNDVRGQTNSLEAWLRDSGEFSNSDMRSLRTGSPVVRVVGPDGRDGLFLLGAVRVATTPAQLIALWNRPSEFFRGRSTLAVGEVHLPPRIGDFRDLRVPDSDLRELSVCRPASCRIKLPEEAMGPLASAARQPRGDREAAVTARVRNMLFEYADDFVRSGLSALPPYADKDRPVSTLEAVGPLRTMDAEFFEQSRVLTSHLRSFPRSMGEGVTDRMAWTLEDVGIRPTIRLFHSALIQPPDAPAVDVLIAIQQLYASHYLLASTTYLSLVVDTSVAGEPARYLVLLSRYRFDGEVTGMSRTALTLRSVENQEDRLRRLQQRLRP